MATRQEILSQLADDHEKRISRVLFDLEDDIIAELESATRQVPLSTQLAIDLRPNLKRLIEENYLKEGTRIVSDYDKVVKEYQNYIKTTPISDKFKTLTKPDLAVINQLKQLSFSGFQDVANRFLDEISTEVYKSAIVGKPFPDMVRTIRGQINGVYQRSNEEAINRLVRVVEENKYSNDPAAIKKTQDATKILQTKYAADRVGNNMKKYASQIAHDSLMQFDGQFTKYKAQEAGLTQFKYVGTNITTTREFCRRQLDKVFTEEEAREVWSQSWKGKSGGDPFIDRGGYRCRHSFIPYDTAWDNIDAVQEKVEIKEDGKKRVRPENVSSLATQKKINEIDIIKTTVIQNKLQKAITENAKDPRYNQTLYRWSAEGKVSLRNLNDKAASVVDTVVEELNELAAIYNIPKIRSIVTDAKMSAIAKMGSGNLRINYKYFNDPLSKTRYGLSSEDSLSNFKLGTDISKERKLTKSVKTREKYLEIKATWKRPHNGFNYFEDEADKIRQILYHEFAHAVHQLKDITTDTYRFPKIEKALSQVKYFKTGSTRYSDTNAKEWFCENFSLYHMNRKDLVDPAFIEFIEKEVLK